MVKWLGYDIADEKDKERLEKEAAHLEFSMKVPKSEAEKMAYRNYKKEMHQEGAAHHLHGLRNAHSDGCREEAEKHNTLYAMHRKELEENPESLPGDHIISKQPVSRWLRFKNHSADSLLTTKKVK